MDKKLFLLAGAALALTACSNEEPVAINNGNAIGFRTAVSSRAQEFTTDDLKSFKVTALTQTGDAYFTAVDFNIGEGDDQTFHSNPVYFWPMQDKLDFIAYTNVGESSEDTEDKMTVTVERKGEGEEAATTLTIENFKPADAIADQTDLIVASTINQGQPQKATDGIALTFNHMLSQIEVKAKNGNENYTFEVTGVRIGGVAKKGTLTYTDANGAKWATVRDASTNKFPEDANPVNYDIEFKDAVTLKSEESQLTKVVSNEGGTATVAEGEGEGDTEDVASATDAYDNAMLVPQQLVAWVPDLTTRSYDKGSYLAVKVKITMAGSNTQIYPEVSDGEGADDHAWVAVPIDTQWEAGKKYIYTIDFTKGAGRVDPEKEDNTGKYKAGDEILGSEIYVSVATVNTWVDNTEVDGNKKNPAIDVPVSGETTTVTDETETETPEVTE